MRDSVQNAQPDFPYYKNWFEKNDEKLVKEFNLIRFNVKFL